jgi:hypothetical protein
MENKTLILPELKSPGSDLAEGQSRGPSANLQIAEFQENSAICSAATYGVVAPGAMLFTLRAALVALLCDANASPDEATFAPFDASKRQRYFPLMSL